jgi:hypothetical protein
MRGELEIPESGGTLNDTRSLATALRTFSSGLWQIFVGFALVAAAIAAVTFGNMPAIRMSGIFLALAGVWTLFVGKQKCLDFSLAIRHVWMLRLSLACDILLIVIRFSRRAWNLPWLRWVALGLAILSLLLLVRFIYQLAVIIDSRWGQRLSTFTILALLTSAAALSGFIVVEGKNANPLLISLLAQTAMISGLAAAAGFGVLMLQMSRALDQFASFLVSMDAPQPDQAGASRL